MKVVLDNGTEMEFGPGDVRNVPPGHNAWVVGDENAWQLILRVLQNMPSKSRTSKPLFFNSSKTFKI